MRLLLLTLSTILVIFMPILCLSEEEFAPLFELDKRGLLRHVPTIHSLPLTRIAGRQHANRHRHGQAPNANTNLSQHGHRHRDKNSSHGRHRRKRSPMDWNVVAEGPRLVQFPEPSPVVEEKTESSEEVEIVTERPATKASISQAKSQGHGRSGGQNSSQTESRLSIDLLILADESVYANFLALSKGDSYSAEAAVHQYFTNVLLEVGRIYSGLRAGPLRFKLWPAGIVLAKSEEASPWISREYATLNETGTYVPPLPLDAYDVLSSLKAWLSSERHKLPGKREIDREIFILSFVTHTPCTA